MKEQTGFERSICFTFFEDYRKTAYDLENDIGKEIVADYYNAIIDYALYATEPAFDGVLKYIWYTTKTTIDKSIERRAGGFKRENTEQTERILTYIKDNPNATQREIAEATNTSIGKVNKVIKNSSSPYTDTPAVTVSNTGSATYTTREHERKQALENGDSQKNRTLEDLSVDELKELDRLFKLNDRENYSYPKLKKKFELNCELNKNLSSEIKKIIEEKEKTAKKDSIVKSISSLSNNDINKITDYLRCDTNEMQEMLCYLEADASYLLKWIESEHSVYFRMDEEHWCEQLTLKPEDRMWKDYPTYLKMGIRANPV